MQLVENGSESDLRRVLVIWISAFCHHEHISVTFDDETHAMMRAVSAFICNAVVTGHRSRILMNLLTTTSENLG